MRSGAPANNTRSRPAACCHDSLSWRIAGVSAIAAISLFSIVVCSQLTSLHTGDVSGRLPLTLIQSPSNASTSVDDQPRLLRPSPFLVSSPVHDAELRFPLPDGAALNSVAASLAEDAWTPKLLAVMLDFIRRRMPELDVITSGGPQAGLYVTNAAALQVSTRDRVIVTACPDFYVNLVAD
jgi:hypothetical protein